MITTVGSLALVWLGLWGVLTVAVRLLYPLVRPSLMRLHPQNGATLLLLFWAAPATLSLLAASMLYSPVLESWLVRPHCHGDCLQHSPHTNATSVAIAAIVLAGFVVAWLLFSFARQLQEGRHLVRRFEALASERDGYLELESPSPVVFTLGWWNPRVFVSDSLLQQCTAEQLDVILGHEQAHRKRRDNLRLLLMRIFCLFLPSSSRQQVIHDLQIMCEQACDFYAAQKHGAIAVAETLVHVGRLVKEASRPHGSMAFNGGDLALRVRALLDYEARTVLSRWQLLALGMVTVFAMLLVLDPLHHGAEWVIAVLENSGAHLHW